jgi:cyclic 2,3-diphosphoglycerate synthetase
VILEGSGAAVPPVPWDAGVLVVPASAPPEYLGGYLGPFRLLLSDLVVFTMAADPDQGSENLSALRSHLQRFHGDARHVVTDLSPVPLADVQGRRAFFATTAPRAVAERQVRHLESASGCTVVGWSARLADRAGLTQDLDEADDYDVLLTELKAAAVDVACERALGRGAEVVFVDNRVVTIEGENDLDGALRSVIEVALERGLGRR